MAGYPGMTDRMLAEQPAACVGMRTQLASQAVTVGRMEVNSLESCLNFHESHCRQDKKYLFVWQNHATLFAKRRTACGVSGGNDWGLGRSLVAFNFKRSDDFRDTVHALCRRHLDL